MLCENYDQYTSNKTEEYSICHCSEFIIKFHKTNFTFTILLKVDLKYFRMCCRVSLQYKLFLNHRSFLIMLCNFCLKQHIFLSCSFFLAVENKVSKILIFDFKKFIYKSLIFFKPTVEIV